MAAIKFDKNILQLPIGGRKDTILILLIIFFGIIFNNCYIPLPLSLGYMDISILIALVSAIYLTIRIIKYNDKSKPFTSNLDFVSSSIPEQDKQEMEQKKGIKFGYKTDTAELIVIPYDYLLKHILILGSTGSGKTTLMKSMMYQNIANGGGALFIDGKMDYKDFQDFYDLMYSIGRHEDILVVSPGNPELSHTYNPILNGDPQEIASRIISLLPSDARAEFYRSEGFKALVAFISAILKLFDAFNMYDLAIIMSNEQAILQLEEQLKTKYPTATETLQFSLYLDGYRENGKMNFARLKANISGTASKPYVFGTGLFGEVTGDYDPDINLLDCIQNNKIVYVMLPTMNKPDSSKEFGKILMSDFRTVVGWLQQDPKKRSKIPYMVVMDEAGGYANENWDTLFQQCRSANISLVISAQSTANFDDVSQSFYTKIKENTITSVFMKVQSDVAKKKISDLIGEQWDALMSQNIAQGDSLGGSTKAITESSHGESKNIGYAESQQRTSLVYPEDLSKLGTGEAILFYDGRLIFHIKTPYITAKRHLPFKLKRKSIRNNVRGMNMDKKLADLLKEGEEINNAPKNNYYKKY
jgi:energy-coupling factor transporter ATP-binding protein EcfA2